MGLQPMPSPRLRLGAALLAALAALVLVSHDSRLPRAPRPVFPPRTANETSPADASSTTPRSLTSQPAAILNDVLAHDAPPAATAIRAAAAAHAAAFEQWLTAWRRADPSTQPALGAEGREFAVARRAALKSLIPVDARLALELAVPEGLRGELPADVQAQLERRIDRRGNLEVTIGCFGAVTQLNRTALIDGEAFETFVFGRREQQHTKFGLPLHGIAIDDRLALSESPLRVLDEGEKAALGLASEIEVAMVGAELKMLSSRLELDPLSRELIEAESTIGPRVANADATTETASVPATAANTPWILGAKRVLWVKVDFSDDPGAVATDAEIAATNAQVSEFYAANSQGKTTMSFTILPATLRLPRAKSVYNASSSTVSQLQSDAAVLAKAYDATNGGTGMYDPDRYDRWIVLFKRMPVYTFGGQAQLTGPQVRLNGTISAGTTAHELGHTQGLSHSHYWLPSGASGVGPGAHVEYGDVFDAMGSSGSSPNNHFNAAQKSKLGYLDPAAVAIVTQTGTYRIARHDHQDAAGVRGLKISIGDLGYDYWIEHRRFGPTAFNSAQSERLRNGVLLHWGPGRAPKMTTGAGSYLVDGTAGTAGGANDAPLRIGETLVDPDAGVTVTPLATGGAAPNEFIDVRVSFGAVDGNRNPSLQAEAPAGPLVARRNIIFTASANDPDGDAIYYRWDFGDGQINPALNNITRRFNKGGSYSLRVSAHDGKGGIASKTFALEVADPLVAWTQRAAGLTTSALNDVIFAGGKFVAGGDAGNVLTSADGVTWSRSSTNTAYSLRTIVHNGARYVAVAIRSGSTTDRGGALYSDDGVTWTLASMPAGTGQVLAAAHGNGRFVGVGENGRIYGSSDGATWTEASTGITNHLRSIAFANGMFVAGGDSGRILTSADGVNWTNRSLPTTAGMTSVTYHAGRWHAVNGTLTGYTSADGVAWTRSISIAGTPNLPVVRLKSVGDLLLSGSINGNVLFAETAESWAAHQLDATTATSINGVAAGNGLFVSVGSRGLVFTTTQPPANDAPPLLAPSLRNEADSLKVAVGKKNVLAATGSGFAKLELYANGTKVSEIAGSSGALAWTPATIGNYSLVVRGIEASGASVVSAPVPAIAGLPNWISTNLNPTGADLRGAVRVGDKWWIVGGAGAFFTLDATGTFTPVDFPTSQHLTAIAYADGRFVVSGPFFDAGAREEIGALWTSTDGYSWTPLLTTVFDNFNLNFVAHGGNQWLAASTGGLILTSADGINWTRQLSGVTTSLRRGVHGRNLWVVVGASGRILTSPDGVTWTSRTSGVSTDLASVAFNDGTFVACGSSGVILTSNDGIAWTRQNSGVIGVLNYAASVKGTWVVVGDTAGVLTSTNLTTWTPASLGGNTITSVFVAGSGDEGILLGRNGNVFTTDDPLSWKRISRGTSEMRFAVIQAAGRFVAVGQTTDTITRTTAAPVFVSTDGLSWTRAAANPDFTNLNDITYGQQRFVAVGDGSRVMTSTDGLTWARQPFAVNSRLTTVTTGLNGFVAAGTDGFACSSADGITWRENQTGQTNTLRGSAYGNGRYVLVGDGGTVLHSANGTAWTAASSVVTTALVTVEYFDNVGFLAAGEFGTMLSSLDGVTWTALETGISDSIGAIAKTPVGFVAAGGPNGTLLLSLDGINWSVATLPADRPIRGLAASSQAIVAVGDNGTALTFELVDSTPPPVIRTQPAAQEAGEGATVVFSVDAQNASGAVFQWFRNGTAIPGATSPSFVLSSITAANTGSYTVSVTSTTGTVTSSAAVLSLAATADPGRLINLSIRTDLTSAADNFTFGVVVGGAGTSGSKALLVRAVGPSLGAFGVTGALEDPKLEFYTGNTKVGENDNWGGADTTRNVMAQVGAFPLSGPNSRDAAISLPSLATGANSAKISGSGAGAVLAELYDATPASAFTATTPRLVNVSVLKHLGGGVTAGFVIGGATSRTVLIRAIGPTLRTSFGLNDAAADPQLTLFNGTNPIGGNDNWGGTAGLRAAFAQVGAFALPDDSKDAALVATLQPGNYTVQVSGIGGSGAALVEVYEVP